jgi:hypothetical protein
VPLAVPAANSPDLEDEIYRFGGRFAVLIIADDVRRIYLDPAGTLGVVYSAERRRVAATVSALVWDDSRHSIWSAGTGAFPDNKPNQYWPAGLTLDPGISRLLPGHALDLATWKATRHYPGETPRRAGTHEVPRLVREIASRLRDQIGCFANRTTPVYLPLTGGQDSRTILACSRPWAKQFEYVTFDYSPMRTERGDQVDLEVARYLADRFGLRHRVIPVPKTLEPGTGEAYLQRIGYAGGAGKAWDFFATCRRSLDLRGAWLTGFAGEVGRAFFWRPVDHDAPMETTVLLERMLQPATRQFVAAMDAWRQNLPDRSLPTLLDFAYLEHRVGCWAATHLYGAAAFAINLTPFCHRAIIDSMLQLPVEYARRQALAADIIGGAWPELLDVPFSQR